MSDKKEEVGKLLIAAAFDASLRKLNIELASRDIVITSKTITTVIQISMEIVEATELKGEEQKKLVEKLVTKSVKDAPITEEKRKLLLSMIDEGIVGNVIDLVGRCNEHHFRKINRHIDVMIVKGIVLFWIQNFQQSSSWVTTKIHAQLINFIQ